jgi:putative oxidoreductase
MQRLERSLLLVSTAPKATFLIQLSIGLVSLSEGIQKFLFPAGLGAGRFLKFDPAPQLIAPFVGAIEILCGSLLVSGFANQLWSMAHEACADFSMLMGLLFLFVVGPGPLSLDHHLTKRLAEMKSGRS